MSVDEHQRSCVQEYRPSSRGVGEVLTPDVNGLRSHLAEILDDDAAGLRFGARIDANATVHRELRSVFT
ncbi:MAG: hypothetical protein QOH57_2883 [Mycobacterium sp.]|nr:hypothetical protein [Mycobacterium sp.]